MSGMLKPWVIIPAHNETGTVARVVEAALEWAEAVVVVDDASTDRTAEQARGAGARVLSLPVSLGAWGATQTGLRYALGHKASAVITMDADGQHLPRELPVLIAGLSGPRAADVVIGAAPARVGWQRRLAWRYLRWISGIHVHDLTSGFRGYGPAAIRVLAGPEASLFNYQDLGVLLLLSRHRLSIREVPVTMAERAEGRSRIFRSWWRVLVYLAESTVLGLSSGVWRRRPARSGPGAP